MSIEHQETRDQQTHSDPTEEWGSGTKQAHPGYPDPEEPGQGYNNLRTDQDEIRRRFGIAPFDPSNYDFSPYPNCLIHEGPTEERGTDHTGGTNFLGIGEKGSGKSTLGLWYATRQMEVNNEAVVWRGSPSRSEWLPLRPWTRLFLPSSVDSSTVWKSRDIREAGDGESVDPEDVVREVIYYDSPQDVTEKLQPGTFNVVYPDPAFQDCDRILKESEYIDQQPEHVPEWEATDERPQTPLIHWWFAWCISRVEEGPYGWTSLIFDEVADLAPDDARADEHETYHKISAMRRVMADSRKFYFSLFFFGHHEQNLHQKIRRTVQWRVDMADGSPNRRRRHDSAPVGFSQIPMTADMLSNQHIGHAVMWTETRFNKFKWDDVYDWDCDTDRWLKIKVGGSA